MSLEELKKKVEELRVELGKLRTTVAAGGTVENPSRIREIKRTIGQILTVEKEKETR
jgi:ribosomal protein L29